MKGIPDGLVAPDDLVYAIRRFDRAPDGPVHVEDFAQADGFDDFVSRLVAMIVVGNTDAHLKNWAFIYPDGRQPALAPLYDSHSLAVYGNYRYAPLALSIAGEKMPQSVHLDHFRRLAEFAGTDPDHAATTAVRTVERLRDAWSGDLQAEARGRFAALSADFEQRLTNLPITTS